MESLRSRRDQPGSWTFGEVQKQLDTNEVIDLSNEAPPTGEDLAADDGESVSARTFEGNPSGPWAINEDDDLRRPQGDPRSLGPGGGGGGAAPAPPPGLDEPPAVGPKPPKRMRKKGNPR